MKFDINAITRKNVRELKPYNTARDDFKGVATVYLDANENPYPTEFNRYPDPKQNALKSEISKLKQLDPLQIILGNGSDEIIDLLIRAFCEPGIDNVIIPQPTYGMYSVCAAINNVEVRLPNLSLDFDLDIQNINAYLNDKSKIIFLCSPNNPSGNLLEQDKIKSLLQSFSGIVVLDEAYIDFADSDGWITSLIDYPNLFLLQTFSKAWGLAGLRLGVGYGSKEIIQILNKIKPPYNINSITQNIALTEVKKDNPITEWVDTLKNERRILEVLLNQFSFVEKVYPSQTNFLLVKMINAKACYQHLLTKGIIVRDRSSVIHCDNCLRITVGTPNENKELINTLYDFQNINL